MRLSSLRRLLGNEDQLSYLHNNKDKITLLHYACTDISKHPIKILCIITVEYNNRKLEEFSMLRTKDEKKILQEFYNHINSKPNNIYVGWNFSGVTYGLPVIERRYTELFGEKPPEISSVFDLDDVIEEIYGKLYVDHGRHGKMYTLFNLNNISTHDFIDGKKEAELCEKNDLWPVQRSTGRKVRGMMNLLDFLFKGTLKTTKSPGKHHRLLSFISKVENNVMFRALVIIAVIVTVGYFIVDYVL